MVSLLVFPLKANKLMRFNIGKAMEDSADLYEKTSLYYLEFNANPEKNNGLELHPKPKMGKKMHITLKEAIIRAFSTKPPEITENAHQQNIITQMDSDTKIHEKIKNVSNDAFNVLAKLQTESNRLRNVSNEYYIQTIFHIFGGGRDRCRRDIRRAKRYNQAIDGMKRMVWPLVSFRLLLPLISISQSTTVLEEYLETEKNRFSTNQIQQRLSPSQEILDSFGNSIQVMRRLASILKQKNKPLSEFPDEWVVIDRMVTTGNQYINQELRKTVRTGMYSDEVADGLQLLSYYGFLVRCSMMWDGLKSITDNLSPLNGSLSRASSMGDIYNNYSA
jgi:hypothetical protein